MMFTESRFVQVLEGDEAAVKSVFASIEADTRHSDVAILAIGTRGSRRFASWAMAFVGETSAAQEYYSEYTQRKDFDWGKLSDGGLGQLMQRMIVCDQRSVRQATP